MKGFTAVEYNPDIEHLNTYTAQLIENTLTELAQKQDKVNFALCGGRSVGAIFELLSHRTNIPWNKVHFYMVDERLVPLDDAESNYRIADEVLLSVLREKGLIRGENCHPFVLDSASSDFGVQKYSDELAANGGKFDLVILSGGEDGHIGAIYPNHHSYDDESEYFMFMTDSPKPPPERMSASRKLMLRTQVAILLVMGESKADLYSKLAKGEIERKSCPARLLAQIPTSYLITTHSD